jgi:hypothetical protein
MITIIITRYRRGKKRCGAESKVGQVLAEEGDFRWVILRCSLLRMGRFDTDIIYAVLPFTVFYASNTTIEQHLSYVWYCFA